MTQQQQQQQLPIGLLPIGEYTLRLVSQTEHVAKSGKCTYDKLKFVVVKGKYATSTIFDAIIIKYPGNKIAEEIGDARRDKLKKHMRNGIIRVEIKHVHHRGIVSHVIRRYITRRFDLRNIIFDT